MCLKLYFLDSACFVLSCKPHNNLERQAPKLFGEYLHFSKASARAYCQERSQRWQELPLVFSAWRWQELKPLARAFWSPTRSHVSFCTDIVVTRDDRQAPKLFDDHPHFSNSWQELLLRALTALARSFWTPTRHESSKLWQELPLLPSAVCVKLHFLVSACFVLY